jgi:tryptophan synthase alpha chain
MPIVFNNKPGLVIYLTVGDPDLATTHAIALAAIDAGADVLELGVPFSDPLADGPVIQRASERAVANGTRLADVLSLAADLRRERLGTGLVVFSYLNPILRYGLARFCTDAAAAGVDGVLVIDITVEEAQGEYLDNIHRAGLQPIFLAAPTSPDARLKAIAEASDGFVYVISRTGITGAQATLASDARGLVERIKRYTQLPVALGCRHRQRHRRAHRTIHAGRSAAGNCAIYRGLAPCSSAGPSFSLSIPQHLSGLPLVPANGSLHRYPQRENCAACCYAQRGENRLCKTWTSNTSGRRSTTSIASLSN